MATPNSFQKIAIKEPYDLAKIMMEELRFLTKEIVKVVILNNKNEIIKIKDIAMGGTNFASMGIKDILAEPIKMGAPKIILVHNHPTGDATPSQQDILFTNQLYDATTLLGIQLVDHLVIGNKAYTSIFSKIIQNAKSEKKEEREDKK